MTGLTSVGTDKLLDYFTWAFFDLYKLINAAGNLLQGNIIGLLIIDDQAISTAPVGKCQRPFPDLLHFIQTDSSHFCRMALTMLINYFAIIVISAFNHINATCRHQDISC